MNKLFLFFLAAALFTLTIAGASAGTPVMDSFEDGGYNATNRTPQWYAIAGSLVSYAPWNITNLYAADGNRSLYFNSPNSSTFALRTNNTYVFGIGDYIEAWGRQQNGTLTSGGLEIKAENSNGTYMSPMYMGHSGASNLGLMYICSGSPVVNIAISQNQWYRGRITRTSATTYNATLYNSSGGIVSSATKSCGNFSINYTTISAYSNNVNSDYIADNITYYMSTELQFRAQDQSSSFVNSFNLSVTYNNGTNINYTTTDGTIETGITTNSTTQNYNATFSADGYFTQILSGTYADTSNLVTLSINRWTAVRAVAFNGTSISNFSLSWADNNNYSNYGTTSTTNGVAYVPVFNSTFEINISDAKEGSTNYARTGVNVTGIPYNASYNFTLYISNSFFVTFRDEITGVVINTTTVSAFFTGVLISYNYTTTTGYLNATLLNPQNYTITYGATGYDSREFEVELSNQTSQSLNLYLLNSTTGDLVLVTVVDTASSKVEGAVIYLNKKNLSGTNYYTVETCTTDANGECLINPQLYTTTYNILVNYEGNTAYESGDTRISSTELLFVINRGENALEQYFEIANIEADLTATKNTNDTAVEFTATYTNPSLAGNGFVLTVSGVNTGGVKTTLYNNTGVGVSGTLTYNASITGAYDEIQATLYYVDSNGVYVLLDDISIVTGSFQERMGLLGLYLFGFLFVGIIAFSAMKLGIIAFIISIPATFTVLNIVGIGSLGWGTVGLLWVMAAVIWGITKK